MPANFLSHLAQSIWLILPIDRQVILYPYLYPFTGVHVNTFRINSNSISSLAYRNLSKSQFNLQTTLERLSSGLRINKASDDSAGSAISTRMNNQIRGMKQANENAQQANNLIQTAENGLNDISGMLSRMRERLRRPLPIHLTMQIEPASTLNTKS